MKYDAVIIGAGMSGLAAGIRLAHYNKKVCIVEKHAIPGGLNSHYTKDGRRFDVGLHAMTNFVPKGVKQAPLSKLLRQLRIPYDSLDLVEQSWSNIDFGHTNLRFGNSFSYLADDIADKFPAQIDGFVKLVEKVRGHHDVALDATYVSARKVVGEFIADARLTDMIFCPLMYYGSAVEDDMDFSQFCIMFKSIFMEGFCRPQIGVRHLLRILTKDFKSKGGELKLRQGVKRILRSKDGSKGEGVELEDGTVLFADKILSSAGLCETASLLGEDVPEKKYQPGQLSFVESLLILDKTPKELGVEETITFFNRGDSFEYRCPVGKPADVRSGVICFPNNFQFEDQPLDEGIVRFTSLADFNVWKNYSPERYEEEKENFIQAQLEATGLSHFADHIVYKDAFTPTTVKKFTSHFNGAIYGAPHKVKDGRTSVENVFLCGTDQGFLGIIGALLSGISMANLHMMR